MRQLPRTSKPLALFVGASLMAGCTATNLQPTTAKPAPNKVYSETDQQQQKQQYLALVEEYFVENFRYNPIRATFMGEEGYNDQFGDYLSLEARQQSQAFHQRYLDQLANIDKAALPEDLQLSYDLFQYDRQVSLESSKLPSHLLPMNQFYSVVLTMMQLGSGESAQPFDTVKDYQDWLSRVDGFIKWTVDAQQMMDQGIAQGVVLPKILVKRILPQLESQLQVKTKDSIFYNPIKQLPASFTDAEKAELTQAYISMIQNKLLPALDNLHQYFAKTYLAKARDSHGYSGMPNGLAWYQQLANRHTTTTMPVEEIHQIGLMEVQRILSEMDQVRQQVGFQGDLNAFFKHLATDEQFFFSEKQQLVDGYMGMKAQINQILPQYFNVMPKADYIVKPVEAYREQSAAGASYQSPAVDGSRPGIFYINTYNLKAQPIWGMMTLSLHEAAPGHHFQIAIKQELTEVPRFQRFSGYTAFEEGWGLYSEYLGIEMGLFSDPYQYFGKLSDEMLRAMRLVVDTGLHAKGWTREQAIQYMQDNSPMAETDVIAEVERYMAIPGQALSYKVGQLQILKLRAKAEKALGEQFDIRAFHDQILTTGSLPMAVMAQKIDRWIASQQS